VGDNSQYRGKRLTALAWIVEQCQAGELRLEWEPAFSIQHEDDEIMHSARQIMAAEQSRPLPVSPQSELVIDWHDREFRLDSLQLVFVEEVTPSLRDALRDAQADDKLAQPGWIAQRLGVDHRLVFLTLCQCLEHSPDDFEDTAFRQWTSELCRRELAEERLADRHQPLKATRYSAQRRYPERIKWIEVARRAEVPERTLRRWREGAVKAAREHLIEVVGRKLPDLLGQSGRFWRGPKRL